MLCGDYRIGVRKKYVVGVNEVIVGVPFPLWAFEIVKHALGESARLSTLSGDLYSPDDALRLGYIHELAEPEQMLSVAIERAKKYSTNIGAFAQTKSLFFLATNNRLNKYGENVLDGVIEQLYSENGWAHIQGVIQKMKNRRN